MRKIPHIYENPFDNIILNICDKTLPFFKNTGHTPNIITTYSFLFGILSLHYLYIKNVKLFAIFLILSYFFDCLDGHMARTYNMTTKFGDLYDHFTDVSVGLGLILIVLYNYKPVISYNISIVFIFVFLLSQIHIGCQQKIYTKMNKNDIIETIDSLQDYCKNESWIKITRFFGSGSLILFSIFIVFYLDSKLKRY